MRKVHSPSDTLTGSFSWIDPPNWRTLLPHVDRKVDDDWGWAAELLAAHGLNQTMQLAGLLSANRITEVRRALDHRYSPGPDRLLDDVWDRALRPPPHQRGD